MTEEVVSAEEAVFHLQGEVERLTREKQSLEYQIALRDGRAEGDYDVAVLVYVRVRESHISDADYVAENAVRQALIRASIKDEQTQVRHLYAENPSGQRFGPVRLAKVSILGRGQYESGITIRPSHEPFRFFERPVEPAEGAE